MVGLDEVVLLHISHKDEYLYEKLVDLLEESGYQVNHLQSRVIPIQRVGNNTRKTSSVSK